MKNSSKWCAIYMPATDDDPSRCGFNSEDEGWEYASSRFCKDCKKAWDIGKGFDSCSAEWDVGTHESWEECGLIINEDGTIKEEE